MARSSKSCASSAGTPVAPAPSPVPSSERRRSSAATPWSMPATMHSSSTTEPSPSSTSGATTERGLISTRVGFATAVMGAPPPVAAREPAHRPRAAMRRPLPVRRRFAPRSSRPPEDVPVVDAVHEVLQLDRERLHHRQAGHVHGAVAEPVLPSAVRLGLEVGALVEDLQLGFGIEIVVDQHPLAAHDGRASGL